jgi:hypothetical protein
MIAVTTENGKQWNRVTTAVGYSSSSDRVAHFGLGHDRLAREIEMRWPSGAIERCRNISADQLITVREGSGCVADSAVGEPR